MFPIIGIVVVFGAIIGGYLMEHGKLAVLMQPAELLIIFGAAVGTVLIANPLPVVIQMLKGISGVFAGNKFDKTFYLENLKMLYEIFNYARKSGLAKLEGDVEEPQKSPIFLKYKNFLKNHHAVHFVCDTMRMAVTGGMGDFEIDQMMEQDIEVHHREVSTPVTALSTMADALPGLGIVAAVLGVVITMGSLGGPPEEIGHKVAAALVGTFLGILLCYGLFGPLAQSMQKINDAEGEYYNVLRVALVTFIKGMPAIMAVETARRSVPSGVRPSFQEMEKNCKTATTGAAPVAAGAPAAAAPAARG
jgi:chemotaxis protein MotA